MQVKIIIEGTDQDGIKSISENYAIMSEEKNGYRLAYSEDLSGEGVLTETTMFISKSELRIIRRGELESDFIYSNDLTHNTSYKTAFGIIPLTLITNSFEYLDMLKDNDSHLKINTSYAIDMGDSLMPPAVMDMKIIIKVLEDC